MAIIFLNLSECPICKKTLDDGQDIVLFPPFTSDKNHKFYLFNDEGVHRSCLQKTTLGLEALQFLETQLSI
ncbi:hypothetical protein EG341_05480 [Chryseobacterium lactis]|uniref:Uncharacterized protein n=1 Tax=Chryseobacterium lactis TaxID=1241981 RepID=A0ABN5RMS5_CHRLC|nr:hypothetical protein EG342_14615 [Chryseobacterium lactis]AZB03418.1 hypothetical protein EG341_05480 [Chryseobacterium lactis]